MLTRRAGIACCVRSATSCELVHRHVPGPDLAIGMLTGAAADTNVVFHLIG
jgi:hypothetical protein